jgi:AAA15 family ATPase/GTPase
MLIEFRVSNYRSIRDEQTLSLVPSKDLTYFDSHQAETTNEGVPRLLRSAAIYGLNGAGKSNLIKAIYFMKSLVYESATLIQAGQNLNVQPFLLDNARSKEPSEFEITFFVKGIRYQYGFKLTFERILEEWLLVYKTAKPEQWFRRFYNDKSKQEEYKFSTRLFGKRKVWQESTRQNSLFLSTAVHLNSDQLLPIFNWISNQLVCLSAGGILPDFSIQKLQDLEYKDEMEKFLISSDISISHISLVPRKQRKQQLIVNANSTNIHSEEIDILWPKFHHKSDSGSSVFELQDESDGTQRLFALSGLVLRALKKGQTLIVDELETSLHPLLVIHLVRMFHDPKLNRHGAQLIFSTHNTSFLDADLFRRDQIWFVDKNRDQSTVLQPLIDFSPRKGENLESGYLTGRYGAIPILRDME